MTDDAAKRRRTSLLCTVALACLVATSPATAQSMAPLPGLEPTPAEPRPRAPAPGEDGATPTACVPPGMPALDELVSVGHQTLVAPVEGTDETVIVDAIGLITKDHLAQYRRGEGRPDFIAYYVHGHLAAVDDHPGDPSEPHLVDIGMVSLQGATLVQGMPVCHWVRLPQTPVAGRAATPSIRI